MEKSCQNCNHEPFSDICKTCTGHDKWEHCAKADSGKPQLTLVPQQIIWDICKIRMYGNKKYGDPNNWKTVEPERYRDAACRHMLAYLADPDSVDEESGYYHLDHLACNIAFLCDMEARRRKELKNEG